MLTTHLVMKQDASREEIIEAKNEVRKLLDPKTFEHVTVDVELEGEDCMVRAGQTHHDAGSYQHSPFRH